MSPRARCSASSFSGWSGWGSYLLDAHIDGTLLIFTHVDRPGLIGFIGRILGDEGVNIAQMNVGREQQGGEAIGVVNLDSVPSPQSLEAFAKHRHPEPQRDQAAADGRAAPLAGVVTSPGFCLPRFQNAQRNKNPITRSMNANGFQRPGMPSAFQYQKHDCAIRTLQQDPIGIRFRFSVGLAAIAANISPKMTRSTPGNWT